MQRENIAHQQYSPFNQTEYITAHFTPDSFPFGVGAPVFDQNTDSKDTNYA